MVWLKNGSGEAYTVSREARRDRARARSQRDAARAQRVRDAVTLRTRRSARADAERQQGGG